MIKRSFLKTNKVNCVVDYNNQVEVCYWSRNHCQDRDCCQDGNHCQDGVEHSANQNCSSANCH